MAEWGRKSLNHTKKFPMIQWVTGNTKDTDEGE